MTRHNGPYKMNGHLVLRLRNSPVRVSPPPDIGLDTIHLISTFFQPFAEKLLHFLCELRKQELAKKDRDVKRALKAKDQEMAEMKQNLERIKWEKEELEQKFKSTFGFNMSDIRYTQKLNPGKTGTIRIPGTFVSQYPYRQTYSSSMKRYKYRVW